MPSIRIWIVQKVLDKLGPDSFTVSAPECEKLDSYKLWINAPENKSVLIDKLVDVNQLQGRAYNSKSDSHDIDTLIATTSENLSKVTIRHYYRCETLEYNSLLKLALRNLSGFDKLIVNVKIALNKIAQSLHNSKTLHIKSRHELLRFIVEKYGNEKDFGLLMLSTAMYSLRFFKNPQRPNIQRKIRLYLDSFVASGELEIKDYRYKVTGKAIVTLERFEIEERRHSDSLSVQRKILFLTCVIALSAIIQAGVVKLAPLIDLSR